VRPVSLTLEAFGPFSGRQEIDFTALGGGELFLVHGPTGAGKTTLFDALVFALYGEVPGTRPEARLRADLAAEGSPARVTFRFGLGADLYRAERTAAWERPKKRGVGTKHEPQTASLVREAPGGATVVAAKPTEVTAAVERLLGMAAGQFTQVALLPQGEFKRLLVADARDREALLQRLFGTEAWAEVERALVDRKIGLERRGKELRTRAEEALAGRTPEALAAARAGADAALSRAEAAALATKAVAAEATDRLNAASALDRRFLDLAAARETAERLRADEPRLREDERRLARGGEAERVRERVEASRAAARARADRAEAERRSLAALEADRAGRARAAQALAAAQGPEGRRELDAAEAARARVDGELMRLRPLAAEDGALAEALAALEAALRAARERDSAQAEAARQRGAVERAEGTATAAKGASEAAKASESKVAAAYERDLAAWLAREALSPGAPCPVCGSSEHPKPAAPSAGTLTGRKELQAAREATRQAERALAEAVRQRDLAAQALASAAEAATAANEREARPAAALEAEVAAAREARGRSRAAADRLGKLDAEARTADEGIARARAALDARLDAARKVDAKAESALRVAEAEALAATAERERAAEAESATAAAAEQAAGAAGFADLAECAAALLSDAERALLAASVQQRKDAAGAAARQVAALAAELDGVVRPDVATARAAQAAAARDATGAAETKAHAEAERRALATTAERLGTLGAEAAKVEAELAVVGRVAQLSRGDNPLGMSLQRFVLAARLEEVAEAASRRLHAMSDGRFRLRHDVAMERKGSAAGLGLVVEDAETGVTDRPVAALSGGESFLASLSLALGLSDVVLRRSGGRRLDALFVDEGFGTLDEETLDHAIRVLEGLGGEGRIVGVISHVAELRRRIPARIEVRREPGGSTAIVRGL